MNGRNKVITLSIIIIVILNNWSDIECQFCGCNTARLVPRFIFGGQRCRQVLFARRRRRRLARGVSEVLIGVQAYCVPTCATQVQVTGIQNCIQTALNSNARIARLLIQCSPTNEIVCQANTLLSLNRCVARRARSGTNFVSPVLQRCFRVSLSLATIDCLRRRYPYIRRLLPIGVGPGGSVSQIASKSSRLTQRMRFRRVLKISRRNG